MRRAEGEPEPREPFSESELEAASPRRAGDPWTRAFLGLVALGASIGGVVISRAHGDLGDRMEIYQKVTSEATKAAAAESKATAEAARATAEATRDTARATADATRVAVEKIDQLVRRFDDLHRDFATSEEGRKNAERRHDELAAEVRQMSERLRQVELANAAGRRGDK